MSDRTAIVHQDSAHRVENGLASSLASLRSILKIDSPTRPSHPKSLLRGFERITELENQLKEEKQLRDKQERSYEALSKHNKELAMQVELLTKSRATMEDKYHKSDRALQAEKAQTVEKQSEWTKEKENLEKINAEHSNEIERLKARSLFFQRQNEELKEFQQQAYDLKAELEALKNEMDEKQAQHEERNKNEINLREELERRLEDTESTLKSELESVKSELNETKGELSGAFGSLCSFLTAMKDDSGEGDGENESSDLETLVSKVGAVMEEMRTSIALMQSEKDDIARELDFSRNGNEEMASALASSREQYRQTKSELETLKEAYEDQRYRLFELKDKLKLESGESDNESSPPSGEEDRREAPDSSSVRADNTQRGDPESPGSMADLGTEEAPSPLQHSSRETDPRDSDQSKDPESDDPRSPKSSEGDELSPAKRNADTLYEGQDDDNLDDAEDQNSEEEDHGDQSSPKRLKLDEADHHGIDI